MEGPEHRAIEVGVITSGPDFTEEWKSIASNERNVLDTHTAINSPNARPRPAGIGRRPPSSSVGAPGPAGCARAFEIASLSLRLRTSMYDPSCTMGMEGCANGDAVRLKLVKDSLDEERGMRSMGALVSGRGLGVGEGDVGLLTGLRNEGVLSAYISSKVTCRE